MGSDTITAFGRRAVLVAACIVLSGCAASLADYEDGGVSLDLAEFFSGPIQAWGIVQDRSGKVVRRFEVDMVGRWDGDEGVLEEDFRFADGQIQRRVWRFSKIASQRYVGTAADVTGQAEGEVAGFALRWRYTLQVEVDGKTWDVHFDDWMYLLDDRTMINRSEMRKFGFRVGEVTLFFRKPAAAGVGKEAA